MYTKYIINLFDVALAPLLINTNLQFIPKLEHPRNILNGDLACSIALQLARPLQKNSKELARIIVDAILAQPEHKRFIKSINIVDPGFINLNLHEFIKQEVVKIICSKREKYGVNNVGHGKKVLLEFISANPTGPLHVGHARQGVLGATLSALLATQGYQVTCEFYYNDTGKQINTLAASVQARAKGFKPGDLKWPQPAYHGDYIIDIAQDFLNKKTILNRDGKLITANGNIEDIDSIRLFSVNYLRKEQDLDLLDFGIKFDDYYRESSLYETGKVCNIVRALILSGKTYEQDNALWFRTTDYGDDKDRVIRKSDGTYTYFVPDIAYHLTKWQRGFNRAINIQGSDHYGTVTRVRAGLQAINLGIPKDYPEYILHKMVTIIKHSKEIKISKRAGSYVTLSDLIKWVSNLQEISKANNGYNQKINLTRGKDAIRFFLISRKSDSEFIFNIDVALARSDVNPVYYIQYAHARICSVLNNWGGDEITLSQVHDLSPLITRCESHLLMKLADYPNMLVNALNEFEMHYIASYLQDLAKIFHNYYNTERILIDNNRIKMARLALISATRQVLCNGLTLIGVSSPIKM